MNADCKNKDKSKALDINVINTINKIFKYKYIYQI